MLNFEEDHTPDLFAQTARFSDAPPAPSAQEVHSSALTGINNLRRVRVEDKRVINGGADVNQLVPFKYKWAWEKSSPAAPTTGCRRK